MKILIITLLYPLEKNPGRGLFVAQHIHDLEEAGHEVRIVNPLPRMIRYAETRRSTLTGVARTKRKYSTLQHMILAPKYTDFPEHPYPRWTMRSIGAKAKWVEKNLGTWRPDVIICHTIFPVGKLADTLSKRWSVPWVGVVHGHDIDVGLSHASTGPHIRNLCGASQGIISVSPGLHKKTNEQHLNSHLYYIPCRSEVGKDWARPMKPWKGRWRKEVLDILFPSDPRRPEKNFFLALETGEELEKRGWKVGITKIQHQPHDIVLDRMLTADVTLITSKRESGPLTARESLLCGTPVVAVDVGDMSSYLPSEWIRNDNPMDLADGIEIALQEGWNDVQPVEKLSMFSKSTITKEWNALLEELVE